MIKTKVLLQILRNTKINECVEKKKKLFPIKTLFCLAKNDKNDPMVYAFAFDGLDKTMFSLLIIFCDGVDDDDADNDADG